MGTPPAGVDDVFAATMIVMAGAVPEIIVDKRGKPKDTSWGACKKQLLGNIGDYINNLKKIKEWVDDRVLSPNNFKNVQPLLELEHFNYDTILGKNKAAAGLCSFVINICMYHEVVTTVEPKRKALAEANEMLGAANSKLAVINSQVAELEEKLGKVSPILKTLETLKGLFVYLLYTGAVCLVSCGVVYQTTSSHLRLSYPITNILTITTPLPSPSPSPCTHIIIHT